MLLTEDIYCKEYWGRKIFLRKETDDEFIYRENLKNKSYEKKVQIEEGDRFLDIGGHIGMFNLNCYFSRASAVSYEPSIENYELLKMNTEGCSECVNMAVVGNDDKERKLYLNETNDPCTHSFYINKRRKKTETVKCININDILTDDFTGMKIDCEGSEWEIINAIKDFKNVKKIYIEYHFVMIGKEHYLQIVNILEKNKFKVYYQEDTSRLWHTIITAKKT